MASPAHHDASYHPYQQYGTVSPGPPQHRRLVTASSFASDEGANDKNGVGPEDKEPWYRQTVNSLVYGAINTIACVPVLYGYASIVFSNKVFADCQPQLAKLFILSSVVHQVVFSLLSSLPYAVGQVQDAGLVFLSKIATSCVTLLPGRKPEVIVATTLVTLGVCTASLGLALIVLGQRKLARLVSYLPLPVIGGQICFVAAICLRAGVGLSVGHDLDSIQAWWTLYDPKAAVLVIPGVLFGLLYSAISRSPSLGQHFLALPGAMVLTPFFFYFVLWVTGESMDGARAFGWLGSASAPASWQSSLSLYRVWPLARLSEIEWWVLPYQLPTWIGMVFVVSFSSCLDIVAIEMDGGRPLNKNHELSTVGASNLIAGLAGGFTGSYIFSQTIFTYRTRTTSRLCGWVLTAAELAVFLVNFDLLAYVPLFFFAATLHFIAAELFIEWLWEARRRMTSKEYIVLLTTFAGNLFIGIIPGFALGIVLSMAMFVVSYAKATARTAQATKRRSRVVRLREARRLLDQRGRILTLELTGAIFFGSSVTTFEHIQSLLGVAPRSSQQQQPGAADGSGGGIRRQPSGGKPPPHHEQQPHESSGPLKRLLSFVGSRLLSRTSSASSSRSGGGGGAGGGIDVESEGRPLLPVTVQPGGNGAAQGTKDGGGYGNARMGQAAAQRGGGGGESGGSSEKKKPKRPRFLILDFRGVTAVDMSSVANCWFPLQTLCRDLGVVLVYAHCNLRVEFYLRSHRLIDDTNTHLLPTLHQALDFCETALLQEEAARSGGHSVRARAFSLRGVQELSLVSVLRTMLLAEAEEDEDEGGEGEEQQQQRSLPPGVEEEGLATIAEYAREEEYAEASTIFYKDDPSDAFYLILLGEVALESSSGDGPGQGQGQQGAVLDVHWRGVERHDKDEEEGRVVEVVLHSGALFGFVDFMLDGQRRRFYARAVTRVRLAVFTGLALKRMEREHPSLFIVVQKLLLKQFAIELGNVSAL